MVITLASIAMSASGQGLIANTDIVFRAVPLHATTENTPDVMTVAMADHQDPTLAALAGHSESTKQAMPASHKQDYVSVHKALDDYRQIIHEIEQEQGLFAPALYQNLVGVAMQYEKLGEDELALAEYERAEYIDRINNGLYSGQQIQLTENIVRLLDRLNQFDATGKRLENYVYMHEKLYGQDSVAIVAALDRLADWQFQAFRYSVSQNSGEATSMVNSLGIVPDNGPNGILEKTQQTWLRAIRLMVENKAFSNPLLPLLEDKLLETYFAHASLGRNLYGTNSFQSIVNNSVTAVDGSAASEIQYMNFANGVNVFKRKMHYLEQAPSPSVEDFAATLVDLGDWYLLFDHRMDALHTYQQAYDLMRKNQLSTHELFSTDVPVAISGFVDEHNNDLTHSISLHHGYIDVSYNLNKYGRASKIKLLDTSEYTDKEVGNQLIRQIRASQFRPMVDGDKAGSKQQLALRYFYSY